MFGISHINNNIKYQYQTAPLLNNVHYPLPIAHFRYLFKIFKMISFSITVYMFNDYAMNLELHLHPASNLMHYDWNAWCMFG